MTVAAETQIAWNTDTPGIPGMNSFVRTFPVEDPSSYARAVVIEALVAAEVEVSAKEDTPNPVHVLPVPDAYTEQTKVASLASPPYAEHAKLILKVSHNLGANLGVMLGSLANGVTDRDGALAAEREVLTREFRLDGKGFSFPTNGSSSPDGVATARTTVDFLAVMQNTSVFETHLEGFPRFAVDSSLTSVGVNSPTKSKVYGKTGTPVEKDIDKAQVLAGYIDAKSGKRLACAIVMNDFGPFMGLEDALAAFDAEGQIATIIYEAN